MNIKQKIIKMLKRLINPFGVAFFVLGVYFIFASQYTNLQLKFATNLPYFTIGIVLLAVSVLIFIKFLYRKKNKGFKKDLHVNIRQNRISGLSKEDIEKLKKEKVEIPVILPYDFELTLIPTKEQYSGEFKKDLDKFANKFSKHLNIKKIKQVNIDVFQKKRLNEKDSLENFRTKIIEKKYIDVNGYDKSLYALTTLDQVDTLVKEFEEIVRSHIKEEQQQNLIYQFKTLINTSITKGYCTDNQLSTFDENIGSILPTPNNIDKSELYNIRQKDLYDALEKFEKTLTEKIEEYEIKHEEVQKIDNLKIQGSKLIKDIEGLITEIISNGYCTETQLDEFKEKIGVEVKNAIQQNDMTEAGKSKEFNLARMLEVIGEYAYLDEEYVHKKFYSIVGNYISADKKNEFKTMLDNRISEIDEIRVYYPTALLELIKKYTVEGDYNQQDYSLKDDLPTELLELIKKYTVEGNYNQQDYPLKDDLPAERFDQFKTYIEGKFSDENALKLLYYIEQGNTTEANKLASELKFSIDGFKSLDDLFDQYVIETTKIAGEKKANEIIDIYMAGHKSIAFYKIYDLFYPNPDTLREAVNLPDAPESNLKALFKKLLDEDIDDKIIKNLQDLINKLEDKKDLLLGEGIDNKIIKNLQDQINKLKDEIIENKQDLINKLEDKIEVIYGEISEEKDSEQVRLLAAKAELIGFAIQIIHKITFQRTPTLPPIGMYRFKSQFIENVKTRLTDLKECYEDDRAAEIEVTSKNDVKSIIKNDYKNDKKTVSFVSFFSDQPKPETQRDDNNQKQSSTKPSP